MLVHYAKCCNPIPGDSIVGFITRGRGVTVHMSECKKAFEFDQMRKVEVEWNVTEAGPGQERVVRVQVLSTDAPGLLKQMSEAFAVYSVNIHNASVRTTRDKKAVAYFDAEVRNTNQLNLVLLQLQKIKGVIGVTRVSSL